MDKADVTPGRALREFGAYIRETASTEESIEFAEDAIARADRFDFESQPAHRPRLSRQVRTQITHSVTCAGCGRAETSFRQSSIEARDDLTGRGWRRVEGDAREQGYRYGSSLCPSCAPAFKES